MKRAIKNTLAAVAITAAAATNAFAQYTTNVRPAQNLTTGEQKVRVEHLGPKSYAFLDLQGENANLESFYGEAGFQPVTKNGIGLRAEANFGNNYNDLIRPQVTYTPNLEDAFLQARFSPTSTQRAEQQFTLVGAKQIGPVTVEGFVDINHYDGNWSRVSEIGARTKLTDKLDVFVQQDHLPWKKNNNAYLIGLKAEL